MHVLVHVMCGESVSACTSLGDVQNWANSVGFRGLVPLFRHLCPLSVPEVGIFRYIRKALEKGYLERPGSACCTDDMIEIFVHFGRRLCRFLPAQLLVLTL